MVVDHDSGFKNRCSPSRFRKIAIANLSLTGGTSLVGEEAPHLWPAFPRDPLGFSQIPGHCATQCRVVVIADMVALTQNKIWVSLITSRRPHTSSSTGAPKVRVCTRLACGLFPAGRQLAWLRGGLYSGVLRSIFPQRFQCCGVMSRVVD